MTHDFFRTLNFFVRECDVCLIIRLEKARPMSHSNSLVKHQVKLPTTLAHHLLNYLTPLPTGVEPAVHAGGRTECGWKDVWAWLDDLSPIFPNPAVAPIAGHQSTKAKGRNRSTRLQPELGKSTCITNPLLHSRSTVLAPILVRLHTAFGLHKTQ